jgi:cell division transport system ATP-binding protein
MNAISDPAVEARGLVLRAFPAAAPFDLAIGGGEQWLIVGEAGSGKTALVKALTGMVSPRQGTIRLLGEPLASLTPAALLALRRRLGVAFASGGLIPAWSAFDNLALPLRLAGHADADIDSRIGEWCKRYALPADWFADGVSRLGRDARMTLALARALLGNPALAIVDGLPIDLATAYSPRDGLRMLGDFVGGGGSLIVLVRDSFAERVPEAAIGARFRRARLLAGRLESADEAAALPPTPTPPAKTR